MAEKAPDLDKNQTELLKVILSEAGDRDIELGPYILQLGKHIGMSTRETQKTLASLLKNGFIRYSNDKKAIAVTLIGKKSIDEDGPQKYHIFISHIKEHEEIAIKLKEYILNVFPENVSIFVSDDPESISYTQDWWTSIKEGIKTCDLMIILCSPESVERPWIHFEVGAAVILDRDIGPICLDGQIVGELPSTLSYTRSQAIDSSNDDKLRKNFEILFRKMGKKIGKSPLPVDLMESEFYLLLRKPKSRPRVYVSSSSSI